MDKVIFIHCADIHLDARFTSTGLSMQSAKIRRQELKDCFAVIIDKVIEYGAHLLLIAGDLFEHEYVSKSTVDFVLNQFGRIPGVKVFISPGNHDPYVANSCYEYMEWPQNVHIFKGKLETVVLPELGLAVSGTGFVSKQRYDSLFYANTAQGDENLKKILVCHGSLDSSSDCPYHPVSTAEIKKAGFCYGAMGHIHKPTPLADSIENHIVAYSGSPEPLGFDEPGTHGIILGEIFDHGVRARLVELAKRKCVVLATDVTGMSSVEEIESELLEKLEGMQEYLISLELTGRRSFSESIDITLLLSRLENNCFYLKLADHTIPEYRLEEIREEQNLKGIFVRKLLDEINSTTDESRVRILTKALYLGLDALNNKRGEV